MAKLNHLGLTVADLESSTAFYRDLIGMREIFRQDELGGAWFEQLTDNPGARVATVHLELGALQLQLVAYTASAGSALDLAHRHPGNPHLCIEVEDLDAHYARLEEAGCGLSPRVEIADTPVRSFYARDPDGVLVEFIQLPGA